ncbi:hypothetical protein ACHAWF_005042 [Thalassiosira exigua]
MADVGPTKSQKVAALAAKQALLCLGLLIVFFVLTWPTLLLLLFTRRTQLLPSTVSVAIALVTVQCTHLNLLRTDAAFLCLNRRLFWILRTLLPPLLMIIYRGEMLREGAPAWYRDTKRDARAALEGMSDNEKNDLRRRLLSTNDGKDRHGGDSTSLKGETTLLFLKQLPKYARRDLRKKISRCYQPRRITTRSALAEYDLSMKDFRILYLGEARKVTRNMHERNKGTKLCISDSETAHNHVSLHMEIIDQFLQRALILFLCPNALIDRYYDAQGNYCAMTFSFRLDNEVGWALSPRSNISKNGGGAVHLSVGYFCLEAEKDSGIWHYNILRSMLRGFVSGLCDELSVHESPPSSFSKEVDGPQYDNNIQYVNIGTHEDYAKHSCGAVRANLWEHPETVKEVCQIGLFKEIADNYETDLCKSGWLHLTPEI